MTVQKQWYWLVIAMLLPSKSTAITHQKQCFCTPYPAPPAFKGIVDDDVDKSIRNLTSIGANAMNLTDEMVLNIMVSKNGC